jgi:hypothetical protein
MSTISRRVLTSSHREDSLRCSFFCLLLMCSPCIPLFLDNVVLFAVIIAFAIPLVAYFVIPPHAKCLPTNSIKLTIQLFGSLCLPFHYLHSSFYRRYNGVIYVLLLIDFRIQGSCLQRVLGSGFRGNSRSLLNKCPRLAVFSGIVGLWIQNGWTRTAQTQHAVKVTLRWKRK